MKSVKSRSWLIVTSVIGMSMAALAGEAATTPSPDAATAVASTRSTVAKWIATQDLIFREKKDWQEEQELVRARIEAVEKEIAAAEAKLAGSEEILGEMRTKKAEVATTESVLREGTERLSLAVATLEADVRRLHEFLPAAVKEKVEPLYRRIPDDPATTRLSAGERFQNVIGILNEIHTANGEIRLVTEIRALSDGKPSEVKTVYVGLGQAYFVSARGEAGVGHPTASGWQWQAANELAPRVNEVIEILENKGKPKFVGLPVTLQ